MKSLKFIIPFIIFMGLILFFWRGLSINPHRIPSVLIGHEIPHFHLSTLEEPDQYIDSQVLLGKVSVLNVFASWCLACHDEHPQLMDIALNTDVPIYGLDYKDSRTNALQLLNHYGNPYRKIGFDDLGSVAINFGVYGTPETFIIDKTGRIRYKQVGPITKEIWQKKMYPLIQQLRQEN